MNTSTRPPVDLNDLRIAEKPPGRSGSRLLLVVLVILVPAAFVAGYLLSGKRTGGGIGGTVAVRIETLRAESEAAARSRAGFSEGGWIEVPSYHPIVVSALVPGRLEELSVLEGSRVEKDQVVARIYAKDLEDAVRLAEAEVAEAQADVDLYSAGYRVEEVRKAAAEVERVGEEVRLAEKVLDRTRRLVEVGAASREDLETHESEVARALARLTKAREEQNRLNAGFRKEEVEKARATLRRVEAARDLVRSQLSYTEVKSPAAGVVLERFVTPGSFVFASRPRIVSLYDPEDLQVRVDVRQENAGRLSIGQEVVVTTEAEPGVEYEGVVIRLDPLADLKKNTIQAKIRVTSPGRGLYPEMICRVRFREKKAPEPAASEPQPLTVASSSVVREGGNTYVLMVKNGRAVRVEVRLGEEADGRCPVEKGLAAGDRVILDPEGIEDGTEVSEARR